jgi:ureidoglycolate lyase
MKKRIIPCEKINTDNFSVYGSYITVNNKKPTTSDDELKFWNRLDVMGHEGNTSVCIVQTYGRNGLTESTLEKHSKTREALIPTDDIIIVAALADSDNPNLPDLSSVKAFSVQRGSAVILGRNIWHHAPLTLKEKVNTFVIFEENTPDNDLLVLDLPKQFGFLYAVEI